MLKLDKPHNDEVFSANLWTAMSSLASYIKSIDPRMNLIGSMEAHKESLDLFNSYPDAQRRQIYSDFVTYSDIVRSALEESNDLQDDLTLVWAMIKKLNLIPSDRLFSEIKHNDIIEVYRADGIQVFRNFNFHKICSYQYPELFAQAWDKLFFRDADISKLIQEAAFKVFSGQSQGMLDVSYIPVHKMAELKSPGMYTMKMKQKFFHPLKNKEGQIHYGVAVSEVEVLSKNLKRNIEPELNI